MPILAILNGRYLAIRAGFDEKSKVAPNDPQMVWEHFGGVLLRFSAIFRDFTALVNPIYSENRLFWPF